MRERNAAKGVAALASIALMLAIWPATSDAYRTLLAKKHADPCTQAGVGLKGGVAHRIFTADGDEGNGEVSVALICSPRKKFPAPSAGKFVDTWIDSRDFFSGDGAGPYEPAVTPSFLHGPVPNNLRLHTLRVSKAVKDALLAGGAALGSTLAISAVVCAAGGIETLGLSCAGVAAELGAAAAKALGSAVAAVIKDFWRSQWPLFKLAANTRWFVWMEKGGMFWNSVAKLDQYTLNPSLSNARLGPNKQIRVGVQFTSAAAGGGPDFFDIKPSGELTDRAKAEAERMSEPVDSAYLLRSIRTSNFNHGVLGVHPDGPHRVRTGSRGRDDLLRGGPDDDTLHGVGGNNKLIAGAGHDTVQGGRGNDVIAGGPGDDHLNGAAGNDRIYGGAGANTLIAGGGRNVLAGGRGSDTIAGWGRRTIVRTGRNRRGETDYVNVRNHRGHDLVICESRRSVVAADRTDRVRGKCGRVIRRGPVFAPRRR